jgi:hypothetical protein
MSNRDFLGEIQYDPSEYDDEHDDDDKVSIEEEKRAIRAAPNDAVLHIVREYTRARFDTPGDGMPHHYMIDQDETLIYQWKLLWRMAPANWIFAIVVIVLSYLTNNLPMVYTFIVVLVMNGFILVFVAYLRWYTLAFFFLVYQLAVLFYTAYQAVAQIADVYKCDSPHCDHGKKAMYDFNWLFLMAYVGYFILVTRTLLAILIGYRAVKEMTIIIPAQTVS